MIKRFIYVVIMLRVLAGSANAQDILALTEERPPYNYQENDTITGVSTEIVQATLDTAGIQAEFRLYPWARAYQTALEKENVLLYTIVRSPEREDLFHWVGPIIPSVKIFLYKLAERDDIVINSLDDAKQYVIGVVRADSMHEYLLEQGFEEGKHLIVATYEKQSLAKLRRGQVDVIVEGELSLPLRLKSLEFELGNIEKAFLVVEWKDILYMALSKQMPTDLVERVKTAFEQLQTEGVVDAILERSMRTPQ